jgi:hypothetical protein
MFNFVADEISKGRVYPALAQWRARPYTPGWRKFQDHFPKTIPLRIQEYCDQHQYPLLASTKIDDLAFPIFYPVGLGFFDFDIDYVDLLPVEIKKLLKDESIKLLFLYHEGDNPGKIKQRLDQLCVKHNLPGRCYVFVSANSAADQLDNFVSFVDFELWYYQRNLDQPPLAISTGPRSRNFTVLNRLHKTWRATAMSDLWRENILDNSYWSYCERDDRSDLDCPIEIDSISGLRDARAEFSDRTPVYCDTYDQDTRNDHSVTPPRFYQDAWFNIVMETHFDADASGGMFLTEKTFKPIKHGQPFFVAGTAGSLAQLKQLGYRTFDHVIDNSYDQEPDSTKRWILLRKSIQAALDQGLENLFADCVDDIRHNQQLFMASKYNRLNSLEEKINLCL